MADIQRWEVPFRRNEITGELLPQDLYESASGDYVLFADYERDVRDMVATHERAVAAKDARFECLLRNAIKMASYREKRIRPLWGLVRDLTGYGSTTAKALCRSLGWNPDASARDRLPPPPAGESEVQS